MIRRVVAPLFALGLTLASPLAWAHDPTFAELLARAEAQLAAGHYRSPPGDNFDETTMSLIGALGQATPEQITALNLLLTDELAAVSGSTSRATGAPVNRGVAGSPTEAGKQTPTPSRREEMQRPAWPSLTAEVGRTDRGSDTGWIEISPRSAVAASLAAEATVPAAAPAFPSPATDDPTIPAISAPHPAALPPSAKAEDAPTALAGADLPTTPAPVDASLPARPILTSSTKRALVDRGDTMVRLGDINASRLLYQRAAEAGDADAAFKIAQTYDPDFLAAHRLSGVRSDPATAIEWYRKASMLDGTKTTERLASAPSGSP
jgi:hypothetical protein